MAINTIPLHQVPESVLNRIVHADYLALKSKYLSGWAIVLAGFAALLVISCSSPTPPPVAEFSASKTAGAAPLDVALILGELADGDSYSWDFGDGTGSDEIEPTHTFQDVGNFTIRLTATRGDQDSHSETTISVEPGEAGWIVIEGGPSSGSGSLSSLDTAQFTARAFDALGNVVEDPVFDWQADSNAGEIDDSGVFTAGVELGNFKDAVSVEFERLGATARQTVGVEITEGPLHAISIEPNSLDISVGRTQSITVVAVDEAGHVLESVLRLFTATRSEDSVDSAGVYTAGTTATGEVVELITVEVEQDGQIIEATVSGTVRPGILDQVHVSNLPESLAVGESVQIDASATDRFGNDLELDQLLWTVSDPDIGTVTDTGLFTAGTVAGNYTEEGLTVRGILERVHSVIVAPVTITPGPAASIHIAPDGDSVPIGAGSPFEVHASDANGNLLDIELEEYEYEYSYAGRGNEKAVFIAGYELGDFENAITVTLPAGVAGNDSDLVAQSDITIRQRSSNIIAVEAIDQDGGGILLIDLETAEVGSADVDFNDNGLVELSPAWWPDGSRLLYVSNPDQTLQIYSLNLETREIVQLTDIAPGVSMPSIAPDGKSIAFVHMEGQVWQVLIAPIPDDVATNPITLADTTRVTANESAQYVLPIWSPDGSQILVTENGSVDQVRMILLDPTLATEPQVLGPGGTIGFGWTSDGNGVHFGMATGGGALDLGTLDLTTDEASFVETPLEFLIAAWAPDDSELIAVDSLVSAAWLIDNDGTGSRRVVDADTFPTRMAWRPKAYGDPVDVPVPDGAPVMLEVGDDPAPPVGALDTSLSYSAVITTDSGVVAIDLFDDLAPITVENFINLSRIGYHDGLEFHRVVAGFVSQAGDPTGTGTGGPGYMFNDEFSRELSHDSAGILSMANSGSNTNGSQFFITHKPTIFLDAFEDGLMKNCADGAVSCHSVFGRVTDGIEIVTAMVERDPSDSSIPGVKILKIEIIEN